MFLSQLFLSGFLPWWFILQFLVETKECGDETWRECKAEEN